MSDTLVVLACVIAIVAAVRGTWSPCGLSMLSSITPVAERARGHRYSVAAAWFVAGATLGGACLGAAAAFGAALVAQAGLSARAALGVAAAGAAVGVASDLNVLGFQLPRHPRQVDETWLRKYRTWVYGAGFGWQIGSGFATYIMSGAVYLTALLAVLTGRPLVALVVCVLFGAVRGLTVLLTARVSTTAAVGAVHHRLDRLEPASRVVAIGGQAAVGIAATAAAIPQTGMVAALLVAATAVGVVAAGRLRTRAAAQRSHAG